MLLKLDLEQFVEAIEHLGRGVKSPTSQAEKPGMSSPRSRTSKGRLMEKSRRSIWLCGSKSRHLLMDLGLLLANRAYRPEEELEAK